VYRTCLADGKATRKLSDLGPPKITESIGMTVGAFACVMRADTPLPDREDGLWLPRSVRALHPLMGYRSHPNRSLPIPLVNQTRVSAWGFPPCNRVGRFIMTLEALRCRPRSGRGRPLSQLKDQFP
jgi:hypothetical protein